MGEQLNLFGFEAPVKNYRDTDPESSRIAGKTVDARGQRKLVYEKLSFCEKPATARELAGAYGLDRYMVSRRLPELEKIGKVSRPRSNGKPELRPCGIGGKMSCVWMVNKEKKLELDV